MGIDDILKRESSGYQEVGTMNRLSVWVTVLMLWSSMPGCGNGDSKDSAPDAADAAPDISGDVWDEEATTDLTTGEQCCEDTVADLAPESVAPDVEVTQPPDVQELDTEDVDEPADLVEMEDMEPDPGSDLPGEVAQEVVEPEACELDYDCQPGQSCILGWCQPFIMECGGDMDCMDDEICVEGVCLGQGMSPMVGKVLFNEVLTDGNTDGDPNQDGTKDPVEDEFVELVNVSNETLDLSGWMVVESDWEEWLPRYTFPQGTTLAPLGAVVLFGGGNAPESTDAVFYDISNAEDPGIPYGLDLDDSGDLVRLVDKDFLTVAALAYGDEGGNPAVSDESLTRDPDLTGTFAPHTFAENADGAIFSPGTRVDGSAF